MDEAQLHSVDRLSKDLARAAHTLSDSEARFLVDAYYMMQDDRKRANSQVRALDEAQEPHAVLAWLAVQSETLEDQIKRALDKYTEAHPMGAWMREIVGIGPVISAGLLAHIDMEPWRCAHKDAGAACREKEPHGPECRRTPIETVGHIWRFAGLDPTVKWEKGKKRPWNAALKVICWKAGQSFVKLSGRDDCFYGQVYKQRKEYEIARNERGDNKALAAELLPRVGKTTEAYKALSVGKLPPGQIDARARRYAVKLFLSHLHDTWYRQKYGKAPPLPYPIAHLGHAHYIAPPV